ncbi:Cobalamin biosynthesis protein CbiD [Geoglobus ahangari]|uniref:Cobalamin biosynthesis protein CbiD n=1 Tax=Geoglobus ahangari TaxID=113653 RepID=A0A0F7IDT5_9EURY|nr:cobalt-precorrin-5B (C(1))-methyltransferase [Geoglobus ahangari]AKG91072.1 Cobalamin biosynthesis protein CbiD [Geoglobus ahangari]
MRISDPIELYTYPEEWVRGQAEIHGVGFVKSRISSGLYILTENGWLRRGITTGTTATAAAVGAISSLFGETESVRVRTPAGIEVEVAVDAEDGYARARKFSGDHEFDVTDGIEIHARVSEDLEFGEGVGRLRGRPAVSRAVVEQLLENVETARNQWGYDGSVRIWIPAGEMVAERTDNARMGVTGGISLLGTTGFVEPWCRKLVETKVEIAKQYDRIAITTGRKGWKWALENLREYQPFVFGVHLDEILKAHDGEIVIVGLPSLLVKWAVPELRGKVLKGRRLEGYRSRVLERAREINEGVVDVILLG